MQAVIATFDELDSALAAMASLMAQGLAETQLALQTAAVSLAAVPPPAPSAGAVKRPSRVEAMHYFSRLFDAAQSDEARIHAEAVYRGCSVLVANAHGTQQATAVGTVMKAHGAIDLRDRASMWMAHGWDELLPPANSKTSCYGMEAVRKALRLGGASALMEALPGHSRADEVAVVTAARAPCDAVLSAILCNPPRDAPAADPR